MSKRSPSADDDDCDRFEVKKSRKRSYNKGGGGCSIQSKVNCSLSLSTDEDDCDQKLPAARPAVLSTDTVIEIIHLVSQQSNAFEKPTIAELEIMLHAMSNMHEPSVVEGSDEANNHLVEMIRGKLIAEQLPHSSDRPFGNSRQTTNGIGMINSWVPSTNKHVVKTAEEMQTDYPVRRDETFRHGYIPYKDESRLAWSCAIDSRISLAYSAGEDDPTPLVADIFLAGTRAATMK